MTRPGGRILVVEDEAIVARDIASQLVELGYQPVGQTAHGEQAIVMARELVPDLVLMDIQLAGEMDGITAARTIVDELGLPVVFLTAFAADDILARAKLIEPYGYVLKPFSRRELGSVLAMALYKSRADVRLRESAMHTAAIVDNMADGVITVDDRGVMESFNNAATGMFGYPAAEAVGQALTMLMPDPLHGMHDRYLQQHLSTGEARMAGTPREVEGRRRDGSTFPVSIALSKITRTGQTTFIGIVRDLTQHHRDMEEIRRLAFYDALTGLPNRRLLMDRLRQALLTSVRTRRRGALMFLDLDHFKLLNDSLGHDVGDMLLHQVAERLQSSVRAGDSVARIGGDEFVLLLESLSEHDHEATKQAEQLAHKVLALLGAPYALGPHHYSITPSIGIAVFLGDQQSVEDLLKMADVAMYQAKTAGRNTSRFFDSAMQAKAEAFAALEKDMRRGLDNHEFVLHYQIQVQADALAQAPGKLVTTGVEALVRWNHATQGLVSPARFIPLAEETGLILPLGQWVLQTACAQLAAWQGQPACAAWTVAVNVSALQFSKPDFVKTVFMALDASGAPAELLKLELTESMLAVDVELIIAKMNALRERGVTFSLDDFGTGYSSLNYLKHMPLEQLKIDQSFVRDVLTDPNDAAIARTIVALGHSLGMRVMAEGVETQGQLQFLTDIGCDAFQGYYFGRPCPAGDLPAKQAQ